MSVNPQTYLPDTSSPDFVQNLEKMYLGGMFEGLPTYEEI